MLDWVLIVLLAVIFVQDLRERKMYLFLPFLVLITCGLIAYFKHGSLNIPTMISSVLILVFLWIYVRIRFKSTRLFKDYFGLGDALFLIAISPLFTLQHYFWFIAISSLFSLLLFIVVRQFKRINSIPFAGYVSLVLCTLILTNMFHLQFEYFSF